MTPRVVAFMTVGFVGFVIQMAVLAALTSGLHWSAPAATALATEAAVLTNFFWHECWTWRDRTPSAAGRLERLGRFHLTAGATSVVGNVVLVVVLMRICGSSPLVANTAAVIALSLLNYMAADRWVFARQAAIATSVLVVLAPGVALGAEIQPETLEAWKKHVASVEAALPSHVHDAPLSEPQGRTIAVHDGTIHEWRGSVIVPHATVNTLLDALIAGAGQPQQEDVLDARVLQRHGDSLHLYLKLMRRAIVTVTYDTEHEVQYTRHSPTFAMSRSVATKIVETGGTDRGFLKKLNSYWAYRQVGDAVQIDVVSVSLSRDIPWMARAVAQPLIVRIGRESLVRTLDAVQQNAARRSAMGGATVRTPLVNKP